jgi:hypothetical protein
MFGVAPPIFRGLYVNSVRIEFLQKSAGSVGKSGWWIGSSNKCKFSLGGWIFEVHKSVSKWRKAIGNSVVNAAIDVCVSYESMNDFSSTH